MRDDGGQGDAVGWEGVWAEGDDVFPGTGGGGQGAGDLDSLKLGADVFDGGVGFVGEADFPLIGGEGGDLAKAGEGWADRRLAIVLGEEVA